MINPTQLVCNICEDETKSVRNHSCRVCTNGNWVICNDCNLQLKDKPCPMCRNITIDVPNESIVIQQPTHSRGIVSQSLFWKNVFDCGCSILKSAALFIILVYLGKFYYFLYCSGSCDPNKEAVEDCLCYTNAHRNGYWEDFRYSIPEALGALVISGILYSCCCLRE